jgi:hypothetical protein
MKARSAELRGKARESTVPGLFRTPVQASEGTGTFGRGQQGYHVAPISSLRRSRIQQRRSGERFMGQQNAKFNKQV